MSGDTSYQHESEQSVGRTLDSSNLKKLTLLASSGLLSLLFFLKGASPPNCAGKEPTDPALSLPVSTAVKERSPGSTRFSLRHSENRWTFVSPDGVPFFSKGVCVFDQGIKRGDYSADKPSYAAWRHYESPESWADDSLVRLKSWGFTTVGGWSDYDTLSRSEQCSLWLTPVLHLGSTVGLPWYDMWDEKKIEAVKLLAEEKIRPLLGDPRVVGYYSDNELGWWNAALWRMTLDQDADSGQRRRLIALVRDHYRNDFSAVLKDFDVEEATSWEQLEQRGRLIYRVGGNGMPVVRRFLATIAERYYQLMSQIIKEIDPELALFGRSVPILLFSGGCSGESQIR